MGIDKMLCLIAAIKSNFNIAINPLVSPQPGQLTLNKFFIGQSGTETNVEKRNRIQKKTNPTIIECRACLLFFDAFLYLCQRLTIAIAESAGKN